MTTITLPRATVEQALEALEAMQSYAAAERKGLRICDEAIPALRTALAQEQAEPKPMHPELRKMWEEHFDRCFRAMPLPAQEQAEPLNLSDRAVQRRLAAQWGYVPAQAKPAQEPVAWVECDGELVWNNREAAIGRNLYTTAPRRTMVPLTEGEIDRIHLHLSSTVGSSYKTVARAIEKASWEKNHGQA